MWNISDLPKVEGKIRESVDLSKSCWFRVGGEARFLYKPSSAEDLSFFLKNKPDSLPIYVLGVGSNVIIKDEGFPGVIIKLGRDFNFIEKIDDNSLSVGCAVLDLNLAEYSLQNSIQGLEFFAGIPGTIGGAIAMNAGAYGSELKDVLISAQAVNSEGEIKNFLSDEIDFKYRFNNLSKSWIFTSCIIKSEPGDAKNIEEKINQVQKSRASTQPIKSRTGGSTFKNPADYKAWELIDKAGCRGYKIGGASVSKLHCNFLINEGSATAQDLIDLIVYVKDKVYKSSGVLIEEEIKIIGDTSQL